MPLRSLPPRSWLSQLPVMNATLQLTEYDRDGRCILRCILCRFRSWRSAARVIASIRRLAFEVIDLSCLCRDLLSLTGIRIIPVPSHTVVRLCGTAR